MFVLPLVELALGLTGACGGGRGAARDAAGALDAAVDGPAAVDGGVDADLTAYIPQPPVAIPPLPPGPDLSHNPVDEQGRRIVVAGSNYALVVREPDALTALSDCTTMIVRCADPATVGHSLDACVVSPPRCATAQPWLEATPCCASACVARYEQLRTDGTPPIAAFDAAFYGEPSCAPGVDALLGTAP